MVWPVLVFDIESIPDLVGLRALRGTAADTTDDALWEEIQRERAEEGKSDFMPHYLQRVLVISCVFRNAEGLRVHSFVDREPEVIALGVARERQRRGIGRRLVEELCRAAARRGARRIYLEVAEDNLAARALYAGLGFKENGRRRGYYVRTDAPAGDAINLWRTLETFALSGATIGRRSGPRL